MMRHFGLIGKTLQHSFSAKYFREKFLSENVHNCIYSLFELDDLAGLPALIASLPCLEGFNVTIPYKKSIIPYLDHLDNVAMEVGAVNTVKIVRSDEKYFLKGFNTDVVGFVLSTNEFQNVKGALILGTGGGAEAVAYVFKKFKIPYFIVSRNLRGHQIIGYEDLTKEMLMNYPMIVNTTPLGMFPDDDLMPPINYDFLTEKNFLYDLVYNPAETQFLKMGKQAGAKVMNGLRMLQIQADKSWECWNSNVYD